MTKLTGKKNREGKMTRKWRRQVEYGHFDLDPNEKA